MQDWIHNGIRDGKGMEESYCAQGTDSCGKCDEIDYDEERRKRHSRLLQDFGYELLEERAAAENWERSEAAREKRERDGTARGRQGRKKAARKPATETKKRKRPEDEGHGEMRERGNAVSSGVSR